MESDHQVPTNRTKQTDCFWLALGNYLCKQCAMTAPNISYHYCHSCKHASPVCTGIALSVAITQTKHTHTTAGAASRHAQMNGRNQHDT
jgi:hypothetical protein